MADSFEHLTPIDIKKGTHPYKAPEGVPAKVFPVISSTGKGYSLYDISEGIFFGNRRETYEEAVKAADKENQRLWGFELARRRITERQATEKSKVKSIPKWRKF